MSNPTLTTTDEPGVHRSAMGSGIETTPPAWTTAVMWACACVPAAKMVAAPASRMTPIGVPTGGGLESVTDAVPGFCAFTLAAASGVVIVVAVTVTAPDASQH